MKSWTCESSPRSGSRNAWMQIKNVNGASRLSNFWNFFGAVQMISCRDWWPWLYHYDPETKQQSIDWRHSRSPRPKNIRLQKSAGKFLASIFWDQDGILLIDYLPKGQTINAEYYSSPLVQLKDILKEKRRGKVTNGVLFLHKNAPAHQAPATQKKLAYLGFQCLDHNPILRIWHRLGTTRSLDSKNNWNIAIFVRRGDLVGWTSFRFFFFEWLAKVRAQGAKKCIELRGKYVE